MPKLTYWVAECLNDRPAYNIRARTKKAVCASRDRSPDSYGPPAKVVIEYRDAFDLVSMVLSEGNPESGAIFLVQR